MIQLLPNDERFLVSGIPLRSEMTAYDTQAVERELPVRR